jgi:hypothetical protein
VKAWLGVLILAAVTACGGGSAAKSTDAGSKKMAVIGEITVKATAASVLKDGADIGTPCDAADGYEDIRAGTQVVVADEAGKTLALGSLDAGLLAGESGADVFTLRCSFPFEVLGVPAGHPFYRVSVGRRGGQQYTAADLQHSLHLELT